MKGNLIPVLWVLPSKPVVVSGHFCLLALCGQLAEVPLPEDLMVADSSGKHGGPAVRKPVVSRELRWGCSSRNASGDHPPRSPSPCPPTRLTGPKEGPRQDCCWSRTRLPEFPSASGQLKALPGPLDRPRGDLFMGRHVSPCHEHISAAGCSLGLMSVMKKKKAPHVHKNCG